MEVKVWFQVGGQGLKGAKRKLNVELYTQSSVSIRAGFYSLCFLGGFIRWRVLHLRKFEYYIPLVCNLGTWRQFNSEIKMNNIPADVMLLLSSYAYSVS